MFEKILIANRGEIAVRIIRACREMGILSVAVYSEADRQAMHVRMADEAIFIGPSDPAQSYLSIPRILEAALQSKSEAVHPGYGFLAENAAFARDVKDARLVFIGPPPEAILAMGDKAEARQRMQAAGVPVVPGYQGQDSDDILVERAEQIGYPVLVKAAAGGGGKGMRVVREPAGLPEAVAAARREALNAFGNKRMILEKYIPQAHHIEFQVLGDLHGNLVHLFERDCSVQRRHQKIIEEAPSSLLDPDLRRAIGSAAVAAAQAVGYTNAGTVEFIFDPTKRSFYFLEMNTRLQVEHPVTELVTGLDLVQWQIRISAGEQLPFSQPSLVQRGHAIECRLYAEDPSTGFLPATGKLLRFIQPQGPGVRVDSGFSTGDEVSVYYDPLIAKIIAFAVDRPSAIRKMQTALHEMVLLGISTNWNFLQDVLAHPDFQAGSVHTTWVEEQFQGWQPPQCPLPPEVLAAAALSEFQALQAGSLPVYPLPYQGEQPAHRNPFNPWKAGNRFRLGEGK
jgi:3-methylcrotonyl-CoA carboxylase alpha subunit